MKKELIIGSIALMGAVELSRWAFSSKTKDKIKDRVRNKYGHLVSEESGAYGVPMECSHRNHSRAYEGYDDPSNGRYVTIYEHLNHHINEEGRNGLPIQHNRNAIASLQSRVDVWEESYNFGEYYQRTSGH